MCAWFGGSYASGTPRAGPPCQQHIHLAAHLTEISEWAPSAFSQLELLRLVLCGSQQPGTSRPSDVVVEEGSENPRRLTSIFVDMAPTPPHRVSLGERTQRNSSGGSPY